MVQRLHVQITHYSFILTEQFGWANGKRNKWTIRRTCVKQKGCAVILFSKKSNAEAGMLVFVRVNDKEHEETGMP